VPAAFLDRSDRSQLVLIRNQWMSPERILQEIGEGITVRVLPHSGTEQVEVVQQLHQSGTPLDSLSMWLETLTLIEPLWVWRVWPGAMFRTPVASPRSNRAMARSE